MIIAVDFDGTIVKQDGRAYSDVTTELEFIPGAHQALVELKRAGHVLMLWSARSAARLVRDPMTCPLAKAGITRPYARSWEHSQKINEARRMQMLRFVAERLPGIFDVVDDGSGGKPAADLIIDDRALRLGHGPHAASWRDIVETYGDL